MSTDTNISVTLFDKPSGNVRGIVSAFMTFKGKLKRIGHAILLVGEAPAVSIEVPRKVSLDQVETLADNLKVFATKVKELSQL